MPPLNLDQWNKLPPKQYKTNRELLSFMKENQGYSTEELKNFLKVRPPAALQRLKKLEEKGFVIKKKLTKGKGLWYKIKEWPEKEEMLIAGGDMIVR